MLWARLNCFQTNPFIVQNHKYYGYFPLRASIHMVHYTSSTMAITDEYRTIRYLNRTTSIFSMGATVQMECNIARY